MSNKIASEQDFHNKVFGGENEDRLRANEKYYSITQGIITDYSKLLLDNSKNKNVLEYGCGLSSYAYFLAQNGALKAMGIDISNVAIDQANDRATKEGLSHKMEFVVMDAEQLTFQDNTFDLICGNGIIHHLDLNKAYSELARTVRSDGVVIFTEPLGHNPFINLFRKLTPGIRTIDEHPLLMKDIALAKNYFESIETKFYFLTTLAAIPFRNKSFFPKLRDFLTDIDKALFRCLPFLRKHAWMAIIVLKNPNKVT
jgi:ubiquinone/menaquinone biosynthesis C-methylase UbiE